MNFQIHILLQLLANKLQLNKSNKRVYKSKQMRIKLLKTKLLSLVGRLCINLILGKTKPKNLH